MPLSRLILIVTAFMLMSGPAMAREVMLVCTSKNPGAVGAKDFVLFSTVKRVVNLSDDASPVGEYVETDNEYRLSFPEDDLGFYAAAKFNRHTGIMAYEIGKPPFWVNIPDNRTSSYVCRQVKS